MFAGTEVEVIDLCDTSDDEDQGVVPMPVASNAAALQWRSLSHYVGGRKYKEALEYFEKFPHEEVETHALSALCRDKNAGPEGLALARNIFDANPRLLNETKDELLHACIQGSRENPSPWNGYEVQFTGGSVGIALLIIDAEPGSVNADAFLHACEHDADIVVLSAMLKANPTVVSACKKDYPDKTPVALLLRKNGWKVESGPEFDKVALVLLSTFKGRVVDPLPMHEMVHAVCCYPRPLRFLTRFLNAFREQIQQVDNDGVLPLHHAVKHLSIWHDDEATYLSTNYVFKKIKYLVKAYPEALRTKDPVEKLYPALLVATQAGTSLLNLDVTYQLLREAPELMEEAICPVGSASLLPNVVTGNGKVVVNNNGKRPHGDDETASGNSNDGSNNNDKVAKLS